MGQAIEREELHNMLLKSEGLCQRRSSLEPAVTKIAHAVLIQAIRDIHSHTNSKQAREWKADALDWFASKQDGVGSFVWVCCILGWEPVRTRTAVKALGIYRQRPKVVP